MWILPHVTVNQKSDDDDDQKSDVNQKSDDDDDDDGANSHADANASVSTTVFPIISYGKLKRIVLTKISQSLLSGQTHN